MTTRILIIGADSGFGGAIAQALAEEDTQLTLVASIPDPDAAFLVQRLGRLIGATAQAIDVTNDMAVRVMVRQAAKDMGGLDAVVFAAHSGDTVPEALALALQHGGKELARGEGRKFVAVVPDELEIGEPPEGIEVNRSGTGDRPLEQVAAEVVAHIAAGPASG
jgi:NAD(P)-dependent dehydrogenase (short-subunit alcohol dehydrogenase family)